MAPANSNPATDDQRDVEDHGHPGSPALYAEMLPLVEAGATVQQAARRFGADAEEVDEIAEGFLRWRDRDGTGLAGEADADNLAQALVAAERRVSALEDENRALRRRLADLREVVQRAQSILEG